MVLIAFPFLRTPKIYLFFERCCQNCPHLMRSSFVGAAKKEVYYFWRYFALVYEIDRCIFRNLYLFGVTWHWYWSASLSLSAFLCYCLISKMAQTSNKGCWREQSQEIMISKNNVSHCQCLISKISSNWQRRVMEVTFPKDCWWTKTMWKW